MKKNIPYTFALPKWAEKLILSAAWLFVIAALILIVHQSAHGQTVLADPNTATFTNLNTVEISGPPVLLWNVAATPGPSIAQRVLTSPVPGQLAALLGFTLLCIVFAAALACIVILILAVFVGGAKAWNRNRIKKNALASEARA